MAHAGAVVVGFGASRVEDDGGVAERRWIWTIGEAVACEGIVKLW